MMTTALFRQLMDKETCTYTYILADPITKEGIIIDPVKMHVERDLLILRELGITLRFVFETHVHADHVTGAGVLRKKTGAKIVYSKQSAVHGADILLDDNEVLGFGSLSILALYTPGHTNSCMSLYCQGMIFTGDSLMIRGAGRTDFQNGSSKILYESIHYKLYSLPDETLVYPGHNYQGLTASTIGEEKLFNPRIRLGISLQEFAAIMDSLRLSKPEKLEIAVPANMHCGEVLHMSNDELYQKHQSFPENQTILDVRSPEEYKKGHIPTSKNIPLPDLMLHLNTLQKYALIYVHCQAGPRAVQASEILHEKGMTVTVIDGGFADWQSKGYPFEKLLQ